MPRARSINQDPRQTAAASENGSGCFSVYWMPPLAALLIACLLAIFALRAPLQTSALNNEYLVSPALTPLAPSASLPLPIADNTNLVVNNSPQNSNNPLFDFTIASSPSSSGISPVFTKEIQHWANDIVRWANESSIDPNLVAVIMQIESCGDPRAISRSGAIGLFQVMPFHFHITDNPFNPDTNALRGLNYLSRSLNTAGGNARLAMAGYNGGIGVISRGEGNWPSETQRYVRFGGPIYDDASSGVSSSPTLQEWYERYGRGLCRQASNRLGITE
jgi:soluble lytic murein transglycosylase-like protein